jgi:hypothetical protein
MLFLVFAGKQQAEVEVSLFVEEGNNYEQKG